MNESNSVQRRSARGRAQGEPRRDYGLEPAPIPADWILEGEPVTRSRMLSGSTDERAFTVMWDCTASRFHWHYDVDETICVLEGSVILTDPQGNRHTLQPNDTYLFPAGTRYHWHVPVYIRKVAFIHLPLPKKLRYASRVYRALKGLFRPRPKAQAPGFSSALGGR